MYISPRFKARALIRKNIFKNHSGENNIENFLRKITKKNVILDYSQLRIALLHFLKCEIPPNSLIATTTYTIFDMVNIIKNAGHVPIFVDIDKNHLGPSLEELENLVLKKNVKAIIFTHLHGYNVNLQRLKEICFLNKCYLIEDCAQSLWNIDWYDSNVPGSYGDIALFSTGFFKNINSISGGFLLFNSNNKNFSNLLKSYGQLSRRISYDFFYRTIYGLIFYLLTSKFIFHFFLFPVLKIAKIKNIEFVNKRAREENNPRYIYRNSNSILRMNFIQKFFIAFQDVNKINKDYFDRLRIAEIYLDELSELLDKQIIFIPGIIKQNNTYSLRHISIFYQIPIIVDNADQLVKFLVSNNIDIAKQHIKNLSEFPAYKNFSNRFLENATYISRKIILLPCYAEFKLINLKIITNKIREFYLNY